MVAEPATSAPLVIGPTWERDSLGRYNLPDAEHTIGMDAIVWAEKWLLQPDGERAGEPWSFTDEQARFVLWWYAVDENGRFKYRDGVLRRAKGWGKDPLGAVLCIIEMLGPCWPVMHDGKLTSQSRGAAWVQVAAVSLDQTRSTFMLFPSLFSKAAVQEFNVDLGKQIIYARHGQNRIEALTTAERSQEGMRPTFCLLNETHHWIDSLGGPALRDTIRRNLAKTQGRGLAMTNAHNPGEDSVAEQDYDAWVRVSTGQSKATAMLYDSIEAPPDTELADPKSLRAGLEMAYGDAKWLDIDRLMEEIYDPRTPPSTSRRFYLNQIHAAEDAWCAPQDWNRLADRRHIVPEKAQITLGLDGSKSDDHTALVGCEVETGHLFLLGHWDPQDTIDGQLPREKVDAIVAQAFAKYDVVGFYSDRQFFEAYIDKWVQEYGEGLCVVARTKNPIEWDMGARTGDITKASEGLLDAIIEGAVSHDGNPTFTQHVLNARNRPNNYGMTFGKEHRMSARKVDCLAAGLLSWLCRRDYTMLPEDKKRISADWWVA